MESAASDHGAVRSGLFLMLFISLSLGAGALGGLATDASWYQELARPSFAPPPWVFGPVWTALYLMIGAAAFWIWRADGGERGRRALALWAMQLLLNAAWTPVFFGLREIGAALVVIVLMWLAIAATIIAFARIRRGAGLVLLPYLVWVSFATVLNLRLWQLNG